MKTQTIQIQKKMVWFLAGLMVVNQMAAPAGFSEIPSAGQMQEEQTPTVSLATVIQEQNLNADAPNEVKPDVTTQLVPENDQPLSSVVSPPEISEESCLMPYDAKPLPRKADMNVVSAKIAAAKWLGVKISDIASIRLVSENEDNEDKAAYGNYAADVRLKNGRHFVLVMNDGRYPRIISSLHRQEIDWVFWRFFQPRITSWKVIRTFETRLQAEDVIAIAKNLGVSLDEIRRIKFKPQPTCLSTRCPVLAGKLRVEVEPMFFTDVWPPKHNVLVYEGTFAKYMNHKYPTRARYEIRLKPLYEPIRRPPIITPPFITKPIEQPFEKLPRKLPPEFKDNEKILWKDRNGQNTLQEVRKIEVQASHLTLSSNPQEKEGAVLAATSAFTPAAN